MDYLARARRVFEIEAEEIRRVAERLDGRFERAVGLVLETLARKGKVVVMGVGKSGHIGEKIAATLTSTGCPAVLLDSLNALHGDLGVVADGDVILALSYSGQTDELNNVLPALGRFEVKILSMTGNMDSMLARRSDVALDVRIEQEACPLQLAPTSSTTAMLALGDALAMVLLEARGFTREDFARYHPGGRLGRSLLLKVRDIMRHGDEVATAAPDTKVREVLQGMTERRAGAAAILDPEGRVEGIFTHGDFARHFQSNPSLGNDPVSRYMTAQPICVEGDKLASEVLHLLQSHRIDDLIVVDAAGRLLGMVDTQDLARFKLL